MITQITDHSTRALNRLPDQFNGAANLRNLITIIGDRAQEIENVFIALLDERALSVAVGRQLDNIGTILDTARELGETDNAYRARLFAQTSQIEKSGELESVIEVFNFLTEPDAGSIVIEVYPAGLSLTAIKDTDAEDPVIDQQNRDAMEVVKAGGIRLFLQIAETDSFYFSDASEVDGSNNGPIDALHGLGDEVLTDGGSLARAF